MAQQGWTGSGSTPTESVTSMSAALQSGGRQKLQELEEELKVKKRAVLVALNPCLWLLTRGRGPRPAARDP